MEEPPGLDALSKFEARQEGGEVIVTVPEGSTGQTRPEMVEKDLSQDDLVFVIVGGGAAGISAAETLRTSGFQGEIKLITRDKYYPYDRTQLSKVRMAKNLESVPNLRSEEFYEEADIADIDVMTGTEVTGIDKYDGEVSEKNFVGYFVRENKVRAIAGVNVNQTMAALSELMLEGELPDPEKNTFRRL